jgi:hypothetical protein
MLTRIRAKFAAAAAPAIVVKTASRSAVAWKPSHPPTIADRSAPARPTRFVSAGQSRCNQAQFRQPNRTSAFYREAGLVQGFSEWS